MQEQKSYTKNTGAKGAISHTKGWGGQLSEWQKQHQIPCKVLCLLLPGRIQFITLVYLTDRPWPVPFMLSMHSGYLFSLNDPGLEEAMLTKNRSRISEQEFGQTLDSHAAVCSRAKFFFFCTQAEPSKAQSCRGQKTIFNVFSSCKQYYLQSLMINYFFPICSTEDKCRNWKWSETVPSECTSCSQHCKCSPHKLRAHLGKVTKSSSQPSYNKTQQNRTNSPTIFYIITELPGEPLSELLNIKASAAQDDFHPTAPYCNPTARGHLVHSTTFTGLK